MNRSAKIIVLALCAALFVLVVNAADSKNAALEALLKKRRASQGGSGETAPAVAKPEESKPKPAETAPTPTPTPAAETKAGDAKAPDAREAGAKKEKAKARGPKPLTFEDFDLVVKRNIFDPNRRKYVPRSTTPSAPPPPPKNNIVLKGTMKTPGSEFASFDGTLSDHRGRFEKDQELGGFKLSAITRTNATLKLGTNVFTLAVGESLSRTGDGPWSAAGRSSFSSGGGSGSGGSSSGGSSAAASGSSSSAGRSAALQRLLEARRKARGN